MPVYTASANGDGPRLAEYRRGGPILSPEGPRNSRSHELGATVSKCLISKATKQFAVVFDSETDVVCAV